MAETTNNYFRNTLVVAREIYIDPVPKKHPRLTIHVGGISSTLDH